MDAAQVPVQLGLPRHWTSGRWVLVVLLILGWGVQLAPAVANRFHSDEALYGYWGLQIARGRDPWLVDVPVYKPPLLPYVIAGSVALFGHSELAIRMPGLAAGLTMVALAAALADRLFARSVAATSTAILLTFSPFRILFSATVFPDPLMVALGVGACVAAVANHPVWAGLLAGLSFGVKQSGLAWMPLALALGVMHSQRPARSGLKYALGYAVPVILIVIWDQLRTAQGAPGFWSVGIAGYGGLRLIWPHELVDRFLGWARLARYFWVSPVLSGLFLTGVPVLLVNTLRRGRGTRRGLVDLLLIVFVLFYAMIHWLWAFPVWDRYLLPLLPMVAVLGGRLFSMATHWLERVVRSRKLSQVIGCLALIICLARPAVAAARSRYPVGGDHGAYDGIDAVAEYFHHVPPGSVVYQHWLGWHYAYYLYDVPVYVAYWPTPDWLAQDVQAFGARSARYIVFPSWEEPDRIGHAVAQLGYRLDPVWTTSRRNGSRSFTIYRIVVQP